VGSPSDSSALHQDAIVLDCLLTGGHYPEDTTFLQEMRDEGGVTATYASLESGQLWEGFDQVLDSLGSWARGFKRDSDLLMSVTQVSHITDAKKSRKLGIILGFQSTKPIQDRLDYIDIFYQLGIRVIQLTYQGRNLVGDGSGERTDSGISRFGVQAIERMNELGILIDLSHVGMRSTMEAIELSRKPCAFTHSNPRSLRESVRNKTDEQIRALARRGGVMGLVAFAPFLPQREKSTLNDFIDMVDYVADLVGIEHVGLGLDFSPWERPSEYEKMATSHPEIHGGLTFATRYPKELSSPSFLPTLTQRLAERNYSCEDIKKVLGGNFLRLLSEVWS